MHSKNPGPGPFDVSRTILLAPVDAEKLQEAVKQLRSVEAVLSVEAGPRGQLLISYDSSHVGMHDIEALLDKAGIARPPGAWWRLKSAWYRFLDQNAQANAHSQGGACCNRPPSAPGRSGDAGKMG